MDIYDSRYFSINKKLLMSFGLWPYQNYERKLIIWTLLIIVGCVMIVPQILKVYLSIGNIDKLVEHVAVIVFATITFSKLLTGIIHEKKLEILYKNISKNWEIIQDAEERKILIEYSERGRTLTLVYVGYLVAGWITYDSIPLVPKTLNYLMPLNVSRPQIFILDGELFIDKNKHYLRIYVVELICTAVSTGTAGAFDTMFAVSVEHCLALFAIIKLRLRNTTKSICADYDVLKKKNVSRRRIVDTIRLHNNVLIFSDVLASTYSTSFIIVVGFNMILISLECVLMLIKSDQYMELVRYGFILFGAIGHLFFLSWPGQKLIDHSASIFRDGYTNKWYESSIESQKLLRFMTLRCMKPCYLTAGGVYILNFTNFAMTIKTSVSYMTMFSSLR